MGKSNEPTAYASPTVEQVASPIAEQQKQGGKCCGGCCDYRRAVIVLCIVSLIFSVIGIIGPAFNTVQNNADDYPELEEINDKYGKALLIIAVVHIVMTVVALVGAVIFNFLMVAIYAAWSILNLILSIVFQHLLVSESLDWIETQVDDTFTNDWDSIESALNVYMYVTYALTIIFTLLWTYPSIFLAMEIKKGVMTKETYPREAFSCCCMARR